MKSSTCILYPSAAAMLLALAGALGTGAAHADAAAPWRTCVESIDYRAPSESESTLRVVDRFDRDITGAGVALMDWEGFVENPQFRLKVVPPEDVAYPVSLRVTATEAPRLYIFQRHVGENPYDIRNWLSLQNETGPAWGANLVVMDGGRWVYGGVDHDLSAEELSEIGLRREVRQFGPDDFPLELHVGIHPDREGGDEQYTLDIELSDGNGEVHQHSLPIHVCDQDRPDRETDFQFHVDYSYDFFGYLEEDPDGQVVAEAAERTLNDLAYFFADMRFDEVPVGACSTEVNFTIPDRPATGENTKAYDRGHYVFITSHSGGGGLNSPYMHRIDGEETDFSACSFWGANPREQLSVNVDQRIYVPEYRWWQVVSWNYGRNGECLGDEVGDPGKGCIACPDDEPWCAHQRGDLYWPNLHELNHGLTLATGWPRWYRWFFSDNLCVDDDALMRYSGTCLPMYRTDHVVLFGETFESNKQADWGRTLFRKYDYLLMQATGWELRDTTMLVELSLATESLAGGTVGSPFDQRLEAYGGVPSYRFTITQGSLPPGLTLNGFNGRLQGTPTVPGTYRFTVLLEDSDEYNVLRQGGLRRTFEVVVDG
ncbi:MAG: Ig domain-containing protein [Pseudomonadota bacterium]